MSLMFVFKHLLVKAVTGFVTAALVELNVGVKPKRGKCLIYDTNLALR